MSEHLEVVLKCRTCGAQPFADRRITELEAALAARAQQLQQAVMELMGTPDDFSDDGEPLYFVRRSQLARLLTPTGTETSGAPQD